MGRTFAIFFERLKSETPVTTQQELAQALGVNRSAITQAKNLDRIPQKWFLQLSRRFGISPDWLEYGLGSPRPAGSMNSGAADIASSGNISSGAASALNLPGSIVFNRSGLATRGGSVSRTGRGVSARGGASNGANPASAGQAAFSLHQVPKVAARLSAGGGSFEVEGQVLDQRAFDLGWLRRMGNPGEMVLMDVVGNSMAPGICDGDTVLVDQSQADLVFGSVYAVGHEDAVLVKRVRRAQNGLALVSDNPEYAPILLKGDDLESFRIIGRVVWLCREC